MYMIFVMLHSEGGLWGFFDWFGEEGKEVDFSDDTEAATQIMFNTLKLHMYSGTNCGVNIALFSKSLHRACLELQIEAIPSV